MPDKKTKFNFSKLSTKPSKDAVSWLGNRSLLATVFLWAICVCRYLSMLQIVKACYRYVMHKKKIATIDDKATRVNVPPILPEIYFIAWFIVFAVLKALDINCLAVKVAGYYYLFETFIWVIYYSIFRRFFEEDYSIYHVLEYLLPLVIIFPTQALSISILYKVNFGQAILSILGNADDNVPSGINVMGILYAAIVIGLLVSRLPDESVKKSTGYPVLIIGNGDVVRNRLVPALERKHYTDKQIVKYDIVNDSSASNEKCFCFESNKKIIENICAVSGENSIIWISCPVKDHIEYLRALVCQPNRLVVCEKPICANARDLDSVRVLNNSYRDKVFYLSYYLLEKALPLYYYCVGNKKYLSYLEIRGDLILSRNLLGKLEKITVSIVEGPDERDLAESGGQLFETFIHNVLIASVICGIPDHWEIHSASSEQEHITLNAKCKGIDIFLNQEKNEKDIKRCERKVELVYQYGQIHMDIDRGKMTIKCKDAEPAEVSIKEEYRATKYAIQEDIVYRVANGECLPSDVDGLFLQTEVIDWLIKIQDKFKEKNHNVEDK